MSMNRKKLNELKEKLRDKKDKANDMDILVTQFMKLPYGQLKKLLSEEVLSVLEKYGHTE